MSCTGRWAAAVLGLIASLAAVPPACAGESVVTPAMAGAWSGNARIIVIWCQQTNLPVAVTIQTNGIVTGKVGDATLSGGKFKRNRGWLGRKLNLKTDYVITGRLEGPIVAREQITRSGVSMPVNFSGAAFTGGVHTSGLHVGGKKRMKLSAARLTLVRTNAVEGGR